MAEEIFKTVEGFEDYQVSNLGRVITNKKNNPKFLKPQQDAVGYLHVRLYKDDDSLGSYGPNRGKKPKLFKVHKLVAETFISKPESDETLNVNHINADKTDNRVDNLEWTTQRENILHSWSLGLRDNAAEKAALKRYRPVKVTTPQGEVHYYKARKYVCMDLGIVYGVVKNAINSGKPVQRGKVKGYFMEDCPELPIGEIYKRLLNIEAKLLEYRKLQDYFRDKNRKRREMLRNNKK